jgi:hypothetical protein
LDTRGILEANAEVADDTVPKVQLKMIANVGTQLDSCCIENGAIPRESAEVGRISAGGALLVVKFGEVWVLLSACATADEGHCCVAPHLVAENVSLDRRFRPGRALHPVECVVIQKNRRVVIKLGSVAYEVVDSSGDFVRHLPLGTDAFPPAAFDDPLLEAVPLFIL